MKILKQSYQFMWEALKFTGKNLRTALVLLLLPIVVILMGKYFLIRLNPVFINIINKLLFPLWVMGWFRFILFQQRPTLKSYFTFDRIFLIVFLYGLIIPIGTLSYAYNYILEWLGFRDYMYSLYQAGEYSLMGLLSTLNFIMGLIFMCILLPLNLIFPALADNKPFPLWKAWLLAKPFYARYALSLLLGVVLGSILGMGLYGIYYLFMLYIDFPYMFLPIWNTLIVVVPSYLWFLWMYTLIGLYYKEFLKDKN